MKKILFLFGILLVFTNSCKKSDDSPVYTQDKLNGTWENIVKNSNGCLNQLVIEASSMKEKTVCSNSNGSVSYESYSFDGKVIKVKTMGIDAVYTINELTDTKLVMTLSALGSNKKSEYKKIIK